MNKRVKKLWIAALRSGKYKQGRNQLRSDGNKFCCLGVLCEEFRKATGNGKWESVLFKVGEWHSASSLPKPVREWAGVDSGNPQFDDTSAIKLNDAEGRDFNYIADRIEKYL